MRRQQQVLAALEEQLRLGSHAQVPLLQLGAAALERLARLWETPGEAAGGEAQRLQACVLRAMGTALQDDRSPRLQAAGWSVVLVSCWTDVDAAWLALRGGGTLMAPRPPAPGTTQLGMDEMMRRTPRRTTA